MENYMTEVFIGLFVVAMLGLLGCTVLVSLTLRSMSREMTTTIQSQAGTIQEQALATLMMSCNEDTLGKLPIGALDKIGKLRGIATPAERMMKPDKEQEKQKIAAVEDEVKKPKPLPEGGIKIHVSS